MRLKTIFAFLLCFPASVLAHGEDKHGPHGGYIRMPGAFHTEVVLQGKDRVRIYLLDMDWKNPSIKSSSMKATLKDKTSKTGECRAEKDHYVCNFKGADLTQINKLVIEAKREGMPGIPVTYELPLKLDSTAHEGH